MIAIQSTQKISTEWLNAFLPLAKKGILRCDETEPGHGDGWGMIAYFQNTQPEYLSREPHSAEQDKKIFEQCTKAVQNNLAHTVLTHFRKISVGQPAISNTHPFTYKNWSFCHNGTLYESEKIPLHKLKAYGSTDSERYFLFLMEHLDLKNPTLSIKNAIQKFKKNFKYSSLTFLMSDGEQLFSYRDFDPQFKDYYTLYHTQIQNAQIISSEPISIPNTQWQPLENLDLFITSKNKVQKETLL